MTATPHSGKEEDFQLFMALLDGDRFEGRPRDGVHADTSDLMRRLVKERLLKFDGTRLFPERRAASPAYPLSDDEMLLYKRVTEYVQEEMNRADRLKAEGEGRRAPSSASRSPPSSAGWPRLRRPSTSRWSGAGSGWRPGSPRSCRAGGWSRSRPRSACRRCLTSSATSTRTSDPPGGAA